MATQDYRPSLDEPDYQQRVRERLDAIFAAQGLQRPSHETRQAREQGRGGMGR